MVEQVVAIQRQQAGYIGSTLPSAVSLMACRERAMRVQ